MIVSLMSSLDIPSNKNDQYAAFQKWKISERTDINDCEKELLYKEIDRGRENDRERSAFAFEIQRVMFIIVLLQVILLIVLLTIKSSPNKEKK